MVQTGWKYGLQATWAIGLAALLSACMGPDRAVDPTVKLQAQGTIQMTGADGSGWRTLGVLVVRYSPSGQASFEIRDARYNLSYVTGELASTLAHGTRDTSDPIPQFDDQGVVVSRRESIEVEVESVTRAAGSGVTLHPARLSGRLSSVGTRWANYRLGMLRTGRESHIELNLREGSSPAGLTFTGETSASADRTNNVESYALGTSGTATLRNTGWNTSIIMGNRVRFMMDLPEQVGSVWRSDSPVGWREEFPFQIAHPNTGALNQYARNFQIIRRGERGDHRIEIRDALEARLNVAEHRIEIPPMAPGFSPSAVDVSGFARIQYDLSIAFLANQIAISGSRRFSVEVEHLNELETEENEAGTTRADMPSTPVEWPIIEW